MNTTIIVAAVTLVLFFVAGFCFIRFWSSYQSRKACARRLDQILSERHVDYTVTGRRKTNMGRTLDRV